ncbi:hypothetical protein CPB84DRAFT_1823627 [Gymnopilus junonius]|uniref:Uncharacterized protein n=1 Tax=Gymnopilus junonius TaxID=109634 RepID=A0A9P5TPW2_GYMJU|nr:hypothetical protein CPB84DRAFT_1823627 [Gymnopilus junonius]
MVRYDVGYTVAVWVEILFYAIYACLFVYSANLILKTRSSSRVGGRSRWIFLTITILMFIVATFHLFIQLYRYVRAFILHTDPRGYLKYMHDLQRWDNEASNASTVVMTWLGDGLVIYRCYVIWSSNFLVVIIPILLQLLAIGINTVTLIWFQHPKIVPFSIARTLLGLIYPIAFVRNAMATGLIVLKIWRQHRSSTVSGLVDRGSRLSLAKLLRIVIESAMIYTLQVFALVILYFLKSDFQIILQSAVVPSVGLVFVLIAVRVHVTTEQTTTTVPAWLERSDSGHHLDTDTSSPENEVAYVIDVEKLGEVDV